MSEAGFTGFKGVGNRSSHYYEQSGFPSGIARVWESEFPPTEESGLQTPPTRDTPIKESGLQTPPTEDNYTLPRRDPR